MQKEEEEESVVPTGGIFKPIWREWRDISGMRLKNGQRFSDEVQNWLDFTHSTFSAIVLSRDC